MKRTIILLFVVLICRMTVSAQEDSTLLRLVRMPLKSITVEYPNKTGQIINDAADAKLTPSELHPAFFGSFDWHSSVHSHWMLVQTLYTHPDISLRDSIVGALDNSLTAQKLLKEAEYFDRPLGAAFERTYGWAWLLKLDEGLIRLSQAENASPELTKKARNWHDNMKPLTTSIVKRWKAYLPKMTYADRIGTHSNSAFALGFALDWAELVEDTEFASAIRAKALDLYSRDKDIPAEWEPNATDFFSPSLTEADLMSRVLSPAVFAQWMKNFLTPQGIRNLITPPTVSDLNDYHIVHLVGLSFSRAWCMASIAKALPNTDPIKGVFEVSARKHYDIGMGQISRSNYGGDHWLGTFSAYARQQMKKL